MTEPHIVILGSGAMGCLFGGLLREGGRNVTLLDVWQDHVDAINRSGLRMVGFGGDRRIRVRATTDVAAVTAADIVSIHCKAHQTVQAVQSALGLFHEHTITISFQNGIGNEETISRVLQNDSVLGGWTAMGASIVEAGVVRNYGEQPTQLGEMVGGISERARLAADVLSVPGLPVQADGNIVGGMWKKLLANISLSAPSAFTDLSIRDTVAVPELRAVIGKAFAEALAVANAAGIKLPAGDSSQILDGILGESGTGANKTSVCVDVLNGRPTEIDVINGVIVRLGREHGIPTPVNETFLAAIRGLESKYLGPRKGS